MSGIKHKKNMIFILIIGLLCLGIFLFASQKMKESKIKKDYSENLTEITYLMIDGAADAETCCNMIRSVWNNSIYKKEDAKTDKYTKDSKGIFYDDFNDALDSLFHDPEFLDKLDEIKENQDEVFDLMKQLRNPPSDYEEAYDYLQNYFEAYLKLANMALNPIGSYNSFSEDFIDIDEKILKYFQKMRLYID